MCKNFHNSLNSLEYQYSIHNSLLHLHSNFQDAFTPQRLKLIINALFNALYFSSNSARTLTHFIFAMNVRNNYAAIFCKRSCTASICTVPGILEKLLINIARITSQPRCYFVCTKYYTRVYILYYYV